MAVRKGTRGNDNLLGTSAIDFLFGDLGNDTVNGGNGDDRLFGGDGRDRLLGGNDDDDLIGGAGVDTLLGGAGNDFLAGSGGFNSFNDDTTGDLLNGGAGNDEFSGEINDTVIGGTGSDFLFLGVFNVAPTVYKVNLANAGGATPRAIGAAGTLLANTFVAQVESTDISLGNARPGSTIFGSSGNDDLSMQIDSSVMSEQGIILAGADGDDRLRGSNNNDELNGGAGDDIIDGGFGGADTLIGGVGTDIYQFEIGSEETIAVDTIRGFSPASELIAVEVRFDPAAPRFDFGSQADLLRKTPNPSNGTTDAGIAQFIYSTNTGRLYIDENGADAGGLNLFLILAGRPNISAANILVEYDILSVV